MNLLKEVININANQYNRIIEKLKNSLIKLDYFTVKAVPVAV